MKRQSSFTLIIVLVAILLLIYYFYILKAYGQMDDAKYLPTPSPICTPTQGIISPTISPLPMPIRVLTANGGTASSGGSGNNSGGSNSLPGSTTNAPGSPTCTIPFTAPVLTSIVAGQSGQVIFTWFDSETATNKFAVTYGYSPTQLIYGVDNIPSSSRSLTVGDLIPGSNIYGKVWGFENRCAETSNILDPLVN